VKQFRIAIVLALLAAVPVVLAAQNTATPPDQKADATAASQNAGTALHQGAGQAGNPAAQGNVLRIISPRSGERLRQSFVNIQFELTNDGASASGTPNFQLRLDDRDPVTTTSTTQTFTGLTPGAHTVTVQLVDANGTPIAGARSEVQFVVLQPAPAAGTATRLRQGPYMIAAALRVEEPQTSARQNDKDQELPSAAGALPLLSVIGFGVLLGGIASAMKTRPKSPSVWAEKETVPHICPVLARCGSPAWHANRHTEAPCTIRPSFLTLGDPKNRLIVIHLTRFSTSPQPTGTSARCL
jgi:hypothetical protein